MFFLKSDLYQYANSTNNPCGQDAYLPIEVDTEYTHYQYDLNQPHQGICQNLTVQCRSVQLDTGIIYHHPQNQAKKRHNTLKHGYAVVDYLADNGYTVALSRHAKTLNAIELPWLQVDLIAFFAVAEVLRVFDGVYRTDVLNLITNPTNEGIEQGRRLRTFTKAGNKLLNWVAMPWIINIDGYDYRVRIAIYDTCAVHGIAGYASFCSNSGIQLLYKDNFNNAQKSRMDLMYMERPEDFDNYALGDLYNYKALLGNSENFKQIYSTLGLTEYFTVPRLTIGATVSRLLESSIKKLFCANPGESDVINAFCKYASADWLKRKTTSTAWLNAKVDGGRCRNNRPVDTVITGVICDIDISSCYGEGLRIQIYPLGIPVIIDYPIKSKNNKYETLRSFLRKYRKQFLPSLWQCVVSTREGYLLEHPQDLLVSWFPPKDFSHFPTDTDFCDTDQYWTVDNVGETKILKNEIHHAKITHDILQVIENIFSREQREELLDNLIVETAIYYPICERVTSPDTLIEAHKNHVGSNTTEAKHSKQTKKISIEMECHKWYGISLGELLVDKLLIERKKYAKKTPFNELFKLCVNTVYGDMVSPFFTVGNVVVGNNITARARALAWCMEKGFHGWQTVTDGCAFDLNKVLYPTGKHRIHGEMVVDLYSDKSSKHHTFKPLKGNNELCVTLNYYDLDKGSDGKAELVCWDKPGSARILSNSQGTSLINEIAMQHLQKLFPKLDILHMPTSDVYGKCRIGQFEFEVKDFYDTGIFHASANYALGYKDEYKFAMRSYSKRGVKKVLQVEDKLVVTEGCNPAHEFLLGLKTPESIDRGRVYIKERILKVGDYRRNYRTWKDTEVYPGCTIEMPGILHEFSLSQFTFKTRAQMLSWRKEYEQLLRKYQQSYEMFFLNEDGKLNYQAMVTAIDQRIREGRKNFFDGLDKRQAHLYREYLKHQEIEVLDVTREKLGVRYQGDVMQYDSMIRDGLDNAAMDMYDGYCE